MIQAIVARLEETNWLPSRNETLSPSFQLQPQGIRFRFIIQNFAATMERMVRRI